VIGWIQKFYEERGQTIEKVIFPPELWESSQLEPKLREYLKLNVMGFKKLENDHRNLVQHCLTMQKEIKYKIIYLEITKSSLKSVIRWKRICCQLITQTSNSWLVKSKRWLLTIDILGHKIIVYLLIASEPRRSLIVRRFF
jgi:hypothetical protein